MGIKFGNWKDDTLLHHYLILCNIPYHTTYVILLLSSYLRHLFNQNGWRRVWLAIIDYQCSDHWNEYSESFQESFLLPSILDFHCHCHDNIWHQQVESLKTWRSEQEKSEKKLSSFLWFYNFEIIHQCYLIIDSAWNDLSCRDLVLPSGLHLSLTVRGNFLTCHWLKLKVKVI